MQLGGPGERCKLPQRGLGHSPSRNRIWYIYTPEYAIWWQATLSVYNRQWRHIGRAKCSLPYQSRSW